MKIKVNPEDFVVSEVSGVDLNDTGGNYKIYNLKKKQWDTLDLIGFLSRKLGVNPRDIYVGGMKDRYGDTEQLLGIAAKRGLPESLADENFSIEALGYSNERLNSKAIEGNNFEITIRDVSRTEEEKFNSHFENTKRFGVPNYFDEQRFGSARHGKGFMGKEIFLGNMEKALALYLEPSKHDRKDEKIFKRTVTENWCKWEKSVSCAPPKYRKLVEYLSSRGNRRAFTGAFNHMDRRFLLLALQGYQSYLWNRILARSIEEKCKPGGLPYITYPFKYGDLVFHESLTDAALASLSKAQLEVPGYDTVFDDPEVATIAAELLHEEGITLSDLKVRKLFHVRVKGVGRNILSFPERLSVLDISADELYPGKNKIKLSFFLKRGSYATLIIKRLFLVQKTVGRI